MTTADPSMTPAAVPPDAPRNGSSGASRDGSSDASHAKRIPPFVRKLLRSQQFGLVSVIVLLLIALSVLAGSHVDDATGPTVNNFWNSHTLIQTATDASFVAIMAVGATIVIISGGIDLSVGSVYALAGVAMGLILRVRGARRRRRRGAAGVRRLRRRRASLAGALNGAMVVGLRVHPFIITLGRCGSCAASPSWPARPRASCCPSR